MAGSHSRLPPSSAHRWLLCGQSVVPIIGVGIEEDSDASREGIAAHKLGEICLAEGKDAFEFIGCAFIDNGCLVSPTDMLTRQVQKTVEITPEMAARVQVRLDYVRMRRPMAYNFATEMKVSAAAFHPELIGTVDDYVLTDAGLEVIDYKDGFIHVEVERNPQLMSYAWALAHDWPNVRHFILTVIQPKNEANPIRSWEISREELELWAYLELLPAMEKAGTGEYVMGDHCKYCSRLKALQCPAHEEIAEGDVEQMFTPATLSNEQLAKKKEDMDHVLRYAKAVDDELSRRLLTLGQDVPGWKVVEKRADRIWKDQVDIKGMFGEKGFTDPQPKSPAQIEKLPGGAEFVALNAYKPKTGLTIAPSSDKRNSVAVVSPDELFSKT